MASPSTPATSGFFTPVRQEMKPEAPPVGRTMFGGRFMKSTMSLPAVKTPFVPSSTCTAMPGSPSPASRAAVMVSYMAWVSAFFLAARFMRMIWMPSSRVISTSLVMVGLRLKCARDCSVFSG